jgi:hypothetical protein
MGLIIKDVPAGLDIPIQNLQSALYENFKNEWSLIDSDWNCYGRLYKMFDNEGKEYLPYPFSSNLEYENPVFFQDTCKLQSFFDILETQKVGESGQSSCKLVLYFFSNLESIFGLNQDRLDEKMLSQVNSFISQEFGFVTHSKRVGIKTIMKDFDGYTKDNVSAANLQPLYAFSIEMEISEYYICYMNPLTQYIQPPINQIPFVRLNATGIDWSVQIFQINLFNFILGIFDGSPNHGNGAYGTITPNDYYCFGRVYRNRKDRKNYIPQAFVQMATSGSWEYQDVLFEDNKSAVSFFDIGEVMNVENDLLSHCKVHLYFLIDLSKFYPNATTRMDEEFLNLISQFVMESSSFSLYQQARGIKAIFNEFSGYKVKVNSKANMQNLLCFRLDMTKYYDDSMNYCTSLIPERDYEFDPNEFNPQQFK